jgi:hypothetical protein
MAYAIDPRTQTEVSPAVYAAQASANANPNPTFTATGFRAIPSLSGGLPTVSWPVEAAFWAPQVKTP